MLYAIKANKICNKEKKMFNVCRKTLEGKFVNPALCKDHAIKIIDCFQKVEFLYLKNPI